jgi:hypothetical protein
MLPIVLEYNIMRLQKCAEFFVMLLQKVSLKRNICKGNVPRIDKTCSACSHRK